MNKHLTKNTPVFLDKKRLISWTEFCGNIEFLRKELAQNQHQNCAIFLENSLHFAIAFFASLLAKKKIFLPQNFQIETLNSLPKHHFINEITYQENLFSNCDLDQISDDSEIIFFTSGSSGKPKQITKKFSHLKAEISDLIKSWEFDGDLFISSVSHQHIYGLLFRFLLPLNLGILSNSELTFTPEDLNILATHHHKIILISSPAFLKRIRKEDTIKPNFLHVFSSGGPLSLEDSINAQKILQSEIIEILGSTETGGVAWRIQTKNGLWEKFFAVEIKQNKNLTLSVKSPYCHIDGFAEMGDVVEIINDRHFYLKGRQDRIAKIEEKRISLSGIEARLAQNELVKQSFAVALQSKRQLIGIAIELSISGKKFLQDQGKIKLNYELGLWLKKYFESVAIPRKWRYCDYLPTNSQGKIIEQKIKDLFRNDRTSHQKYQGSK